MTRLRSLLHARRWLALALVIAALAVRIVVPAGLMPGRGAAGPTLVLCSGHAMAAMPSMASGKAGAPDPAKGDAPCAFTGLVAVALDTAAPAPLPALPMPLAIVVAVTGAATVLRPTRLLPPLRGPPGARAV